MKPTDFAQSLQKYFSEHLVHLRRCRDNTIKSYRDTFKIFLRYMSEKKSIFPHKMSLAKFTYDEIVGFRKYLEKNRKNSDRTRNQRLAAIHSFVRFLQHEHPERIAQWQRIQSMPVHRCKDRPVRYLTRNETTTLISGIKTSTCKGIRDKTMILLLYDTGARVQELVDLCVKDVRLGVLPQVTLAGKGGKSRVVPLMPTTVEVLAEYISTFDLLKHESKDTPLFRNRNNEKMTRFGVAYILQRYGEKTKKQLDSFPSTISPHILRHSKAMHLLEAGCSEVVIQHILGHADLKTTSVYAKANLEMTRSALNKLKQEESPNEKLFWKQDNDLLSWLENL